MDVNYIVLVAVAIVMALAYGILGYFSDRVKNNGVWDWDKFTATIVYSVVVGFLAVQTGVLSLDRIADWQQIFSPVWQTYFSVYLGILYVFSKFVVPLFEQVSTKTKFFPKIQAMGIRKMDAESRKFLVFDLPEWSKQATLTCVDQAETEPPKFQYAILSGAWIFLIENGELTGAKHYYFRAWFGGQVDWKPISEKCLADCRRTGRIPDYGGLY